MKKGLFIGVLFFLGSAVACQAEPISIIVTAITSGVAAAGGIGAVITAVVQVAAIAYSAYSSYSAYRQGQKAQEAAKRAELEQRERNARRNFRSSVMSKRAVYGRDRLGGGLLFANNPNRTDAVLIVSLADHEIEEIEQVFMMDEELLFPEEGGEVTGKYAGHLWVWPYLGKPGQNLSGLLQELGNSSVVESDRFEGTACLVIRTRNLLRDFPEADVHFNAIIKGKNDILDVRTGQRGWTDNAALCAADYALTYMNFKIGRINQSALSASADICEEFVVRKNGTSEKRYTTNGVITADQEHRSILPDLANAMAGTTAFVSGEWSFVAGAYRAPEVDFTADDILQEFDYIYRGAEKDVPNVCKGTFKSPEHNWQTVAFPEFVDEEALAKASGDRQEMDLTLPFTNSNTMAQRIRKIALRRAQQEEQAVLSMKPRAMLVQTTNSARFDIPRHGVQGKTFEVRDFATRYQLEDKLIRFDTSLTIAAYGPEIFAYDPEVEELPLPRATVSIGSVDALGVTELTVEAMNEQFMATWINPEPFGKEIETIKARVTKSVRRGRIGTEDVDVVSELPADATSFIFSIPEDETYRSFAVQVCYEDGTRSSFVNVS